MSRVLVVKGAGIAAMLTRPNWVLVFLVVGAAQFFLPRTDYEIQNALLFSIPLAALALGNESKKSVAGYSFMLYLIGMLFAFPLGIVQAFFDTRDAILLAGAVTFVVIAVCMLAYSYYVGVEGHRHD